MTDTPTVDTATPIRKASLDLARSVLMGVGAVPFVSGIATGAQWQAIVGGLLALASAIWSYVAAHPSRVGPVRTVLALVRRGGRSKAWDGDVDALVAALLPKIDSQVDARIKARAGPFAGPVDMAANAAIKDAADTAADHLII
jgi:hypothetical protein